MGECKKVVKTCEQCGDDFVGVSWARFCGKCKNKRSLENNRLQKRRSREKNRENKPDPIKKRPLTITEISVIARQNGMSYGEYVAKNGL